jgi:hypothetical protein
MKISRALALIPLLAVLITAFSGCVDNTPAGNETGLNTSTPAVSPSAQVSEAAGNETDLNTSVSDEDIGNISTILELKNSLPDSFEYVASLPLSVDKIKSDYKAENVSGILEGAEGIYKSNESDFFVDVIECENSSTADDLIFAYKSSFSPLSTGSRFVEESFNGHFAVKITKYVTVGGEQVPRYTYIWKHENYVFVVFGNSDDSTLVKELAEATGF